MRVLLDSHAFLWWDHAPARLSARARSAIRAIGNEVFASVASLWELQIKRVRGKLHLARPLAQMLRIHEERNAFRLLSVTPAHLWALENLKATRGDPFDLMLLAQATAERLALVSRDAALRGHGVEIIW
ncbi:MAG: type II toxin-antitoxin system VapC family toxin [Burkholderiales bacterium]|nr:type II toxin-antitoxin system VapC family toxin [Burkholderiales bacterium]